MKTFKKLAAIILLGTVAVTVSAQQVTITAGALDCDNYESNDIRFSPATFTGDGNQQKITIIFA
ncbi:MAG: hypothetical protein LBR52_05875 [Prevotellaceae bacterium]|jgi:hypothetical protein|nr:hypothetical protein [Prevotellaceae bacterium]